MPTLSDLDVNRAVRKVLVRHWIDLGRISVRTTQGRVWIRGELLRIEGMNEDLTGAIVGSLFDEIRRARGVRSVQIELDNWTNISGLWHPRGERGPGSGTTTPSGGPQTLEVS